MFGFSLPKLLVLIAIIVGVLLAYRYFGSKRVSERKPSGSDRQGGEAVEDMEPCRVCGDYVSAGAARSCGRADCPY